MSLDERSVVRAGAVVSERERERWIVCYNFGKWKGNEGKRELWELGGSSIEWE